MKYDDALTALESEFGPRAAIDRAVLHQSELLICSGGEIESEASQVPMLCLTKEIAIEAWFFAARKALTAANHLIGWDAGKMNLDTWRITIADARQTQRVAASRFSATAKITMAFGEADEEAPEGCPPEFAPETYREHLDHAIAAAALNEPVVMQAPIGKALTGELYVVMTSGGAAPEGEEFPERGYFATPKEAIDAWLDEMRKYRDSVPGGKLYWRQLPEVETQDYSKWRVCSRVLISAAPVAAAT